MLATVYACLFVAALTYLLTTAEDSAASGVPVLILTVPWSVMMTELARGIWPLAFQSTAMGATILIVSAFLNTLLLLTWRRWIRWIYPPPPPTGGGSSHHSGKSTR